MRRFRVLATLVAGAAACGVLASALPSSFAAASAAARAVACPPTCPPVMNGDGTVTFRYVSSGASSASVVGEWVDPIGTGTQTLTRDPETGVWSGSVTLRNNLYSYTFTVDGTSGLVDPSNPPWDPEGIQSQIFVPGSNSPNDPTENYAWLSPANPVPHGTLHKHFLPTVNSTGPFANGNHPLAVYTPPGYDPASSRRYPTLYLSHGAGGNDVDWSTQGYAGFIEDNLIAAGVAEPTVIVMTNFYNTSGGADGYRQDLLESYIPFVESHYHVYNERWSRAFAGLSMGGAYGQNIIINSAERFAYFGIWSPACVDASYSCRSPTVAELLAPEPQGLLGVHLGSGIDDIFGAEATVATEEANLTAAGIPHRTHMTPTDDSPAIPLADWPRQTNHTWNVWREELRDAVESTLFKVTTATTTTVGSDAGSRATSHVTFTAHVAAANPKIGDPDVGAVTFTYRKKVHTSPVTSGGVATWKTTLEKGDLAVSARFNPAAGSPYLASSTAGS
jgi:hypothetical protein